jgi:membrane fusion protein, multidrug efflux system
MAQQLLEKKPVTLKPTVPIKSRPAEPEPGQVRPTTTRKPRSSARLWIGILLSLVAGWTIYHYFFAAPATVAATGSGHGKHGAGASDKVRVITATATKGDIGVYLTGLGTVTPLNTVTIKSRVDGQLMKVLFQEGQLVKEGDLLLQIDARPYQVQLEQYKAQQEHDQALLDNAKTDLQRYQTLWAQDSLPQQTLATQQALVKQDQATVDSDQALIDTANLNITYCNIAAPVTGRVGLRLIDQGNQVHASDTTGLLVINQIQPITVVFTIPEDNVQDVVPKLNAGQQLVVNAYDRSMKNKLAEGSLQSVDNQIDPATGTLKLKAIFPNTDNSLFPNQFVNAQLLVEMKKGVTLVPVSAVQHGTQGTFVYIVDTDANTVTMQNVTVGTVDGDKAEIEKGVDPDDVVVTDGVDKLRNGSQVIVSKSAGVGGGS